MSLNQEKCSTARKQMNRFYEDVAPFRQDLYRYCRSLTNNPWDAEDLVQETLMKAYGRMGDRHPGIENPKSYLFRMATNQWIDWCRRARIPVESNEIPDTPYIMGNVYEVKDTMSRVLHYLPPKERVAMVLKDAFDYSLDEIATVMGSTTGSVKSALHRAREKALKIDPNVDVKPETSAHREVVEAAVEAFNKRDLEGITSLFLSTASGNCYGCFLEMSAEEIKKGSMFYTINTPDGKPIPLPYRAECRVINGDTLFLIWKDNDTLDDVFRFEVEDGQIKGFTAYYCCPDVLAEIAGILGKNASQHGYYYEEQHSIGSI